MSTNPFAAIATKEDACTPPPANAVMVFDFETVPDESRFPRPKIDPTASSVKNLDVEQFFSACKTVADVSKYLAKNPLSSDQYNALAAFESRSEKPRKGVLEEIENQKASATLAFEEWKRDCSTNPLKAKIVAFGWAIGNSEIESMTAINDNEERAICEKFWSLVGSGRRRAGYNITGFDDALVGVRSILLGVDPTIRLIRKKYGNHQALDLMNLLFPNSSAQKLKDVCLCLKIPVPAGLEMDGSKVFDLFHEGKIAEVAAYVRSDVSIERELMWRLADVFAE